jgi:hypothetical protein
MPDCFNYLIALLLRRFSPGEALEGVLDRNEAGTPCLVGEGRIGDDVVIGAELLAILEFGSCERVARKYVGCRKVMQNHVHAGKTGGSHVLFLSFKGDVLARLGGQFQQQRTRAAGGVISRGGGHGVRRGDTYDLGDNATDLGWGIELPLALAALGGEVPMR